MNYIGHRKTITVRVVQKSITNRLKDISRMCSALKVDISAILVPRWYKMYTIEP